MKNLFKKNTRQRIRSSHASQEGQAVITAVIFFLVISIVVMTAVATPIANQIRATSDFLQSKQGYFAAEAVNEDAFYRLNKGRTLPATIVLPFTTSVSSASVTDVGNEEQIVSIGNTGSLTRSAKTLFSQGNGASFNYGLQTGNGGLQMSGGAGINGNIYSNGDIIGTGGPYITGSATVASASSPTADQSNTGSTTPTNSITFATSSAAQDVAQSFTVSTTSPAVEVSFYIKKIGSPANATVKILNNSSGKPGTTVLSSANISASAVTTNYGWVKVSFSPSISLVVGTTYWLAIDTTNNSSNYYVVAATNGTYSNGAAMVGAVGGTWLATTPSSLDAYFNLYLGGSTGTISGVTIGSGGVGDAQAHTVNNSTVAGTIYCQIGSGNNKSCDTSRSDPSTQSYPLSQAQIAQWESDAAAGGTMNGSWALGGSTATSSGPTEINGDLSVTSGAILTVTGTLYVTGNFSVDGGAKVQLSSSYGNNSGVIIVDGTVNLAGGGQIVGDGQTGSYVLLVSNSSCPTTGCTSTYAIAASGGTGSVVLNAQNGGISFTGGTAAKAAVGQTIYMSGGATITYDSGLADISFTSGPSGSWNVDSWKEVSN